MEKLIKGNEQYAYIDTVGDEGLFVREVQVGVVNGGELIGGDPHGGEWTERKKNSLLMLLKGNVGPMS